MSQESFDDFVEQLRELQIADQLTDFTIHVHGESIRVHKVVLAANSDFFKAMLTSDVSEAKNGQVNIEDTDPGVVRALVEFWYSGKLDASSENISSLLLAASKFQARSALNRCVEFASADLNSANCLNIAVICERCNFVELGEKAFTYCLEHFEDVIQEPEMLHLDADFLTKLISDARLTVSDEISVFEIVIKWMNFDKRLRSSKLAQLMGEVCFASIDPASLTEPRIENLAACSEESLKMLNKAKNFFLLRDRPELYHERVGKFKEEPRKQVSSHQRLYVLGGFVDTLTGLLTHEVYDLGADKWLNLSDSYKPTSVGLAVKFRANQIYANFGDNSQYYNQDKDEWSCGESLFPLDEATRGILWNGYLVALGGFVYVLGKSRDYVSSVLKYDLAREISTSCAPLQVPRKYPGIVVHENYIYVMGGKEVDSGGVLQSVEKYDPIEDKWRFVPSMINPRALFAGCSCRGKIYVTGGGKQGNVAINDAEVYNPKLNNWRLIKPMQRCRLGHGLVELSGQIFAVAGYSQEGVLDKVEAYDPDSNTWIDKASLNQKRRYAAVLVA